MLNESDFSALIVAKARELGADLAGVADVAALRTSPSHSLFPKLEAYRGVGTRDDTAVERGTVEWPADAASMVVIAVRHPTDRPDMDWWRTGYQGGTEGNRRLIVIQDALAAWLSKEHGLEATRLAYHIEYGGVFLKDAAALAGIGRVGKNNLLVTSEFGPRVRLRAMTLGAPLRQTGPAVLDPCEGCPMPCRDACPQSAMSEAVYSEAEYGQAGLPARDGAYDRRKCNVQMEEDVRAHNPFTVEATGEPGKIVRYCRRCEFACIVGRGRSAPGAAAASDPR